MLELGKICFLHTNCRERVHYENLIISKVAPTLVGHEISVLAIFNSFENLILLTLCYFLL